MPRRPRASRRRGASRAPRPCGPADLDGRGVPRSRAVGVARPAARMSLAAQRRGRRLRHGVCRSTFAVRRRSGRPWRRRRVSCRPAATMNTSGDAPSDGHVITHGATAWSWPSASRPAQCGGCCAALGAVQAWAVGVWHGSSSWRVPCWSIEQQGQSAGSVRAMHFRMASRCLREWACAAQPVGHLRHSVAGVADAEAQAPEVGGAQLRVDVLAARCGRVAAAAQLDLHPDAGGRARRGPPGSRRVRS